RGMPGPPQPGEAIPCGIRIGMGNMAVGGAPLTQFANTLGMFTGRVVIDRTGLTGNYDFNLTWTPDQMPPRAPGTPPDQPIRADRDRQPATAAASDGNRSAGRLPIRQYRGRGLDAADRDARLRDAQPRRDDRRGDAAAGVGTDAAAVRRNHARPPAVGS